MNDSKGKEYEKESGRTHFPKKMQKVLYHISMQLYVNRGVFLNVLDDTGVEMFREIREKDQVSMETSE